MNSTDRDLKVEPLETYAFLVLRPRLSPTPLEWITLQRDWWQGTRQPSPAPKLNPWANTLPLDNGGIIGNVWLEQIPEPAARQSLAGDWNGIALPGRTTMLLDQVRREFTPHAAQRGQRVVLYIETRDNIVNGIILNDRFSYYDDSNL